MNYNKTSLESLSDNLNKRNEVWHFRMNVSKNKEELRPHLERNENKKRKPKKRSKRLDNPLEMLKYFISHTSLHGIKYSQDEQLYNIERAIWVLLCIAGFYFAIKVIVQLYGNFQANKTNILIDKIYYDIFHIPFPSVTICPGTRIDWNKVTKMASTLIPEANKEVKHIFFEMLRNMSNIKISNLHKLKVTANDSELLFLNNINISDVLLKVMPNCDQFIFNCSWSYNKRNCCEIFEVQRTAYGFCYTFNSLTSIEAKLEKPHNTHAYGVHSGLRFEIQRNNLHYPPNITGNYNAIYIISHPKTYPSKARYIAFGTRYNVHIKFTSAISSTEVLKLENEEHPPCKHEKGAYKFENCLTFCQRRYIQKICGCNPTIFFPINDETRDCNVTDLQCIARESNLIRETHFSMHNENPHFVKTMCNCPAECEYLSYDDYVIGIPYYDPNSILLDFHFDGPTGVRYKREIVVSDLDMLVQLGGIFGLFLGGSLLTIMEFMYCFIIGIIVYIYRNLVSNNKRTKDEIKIQQMIHVTTYNENRMYPLLDYPVVLKRNKSKF